MSNLNQYGEPVFDDGRGLYPDHLGVPVPRGFKRLIREAAAKDSRSMSSLVREAVEAKAREILAGAARSTTNMSEA